MGLRADVLFHREIFGNLQWLRNRDVWGLLWFVERYYGSLWR